MVLVCAAPFIIDSADGMCVVLDALGHVVRNVAGHVTGHVGIGVGPIGVGVGVGVGAGIHGGRTVYETVEEEKK